MIWNVFFSLITSRQSSLVISSCGHVSALQRLSKMMIVKDSCARDVATCHHPGHGGWHDLTRRSRAGAVTACTWKCAFSASIDSRLMRDTSASL